MNGIPTYMIVIRDNPVSEYYASITIPKWKELGFDVQRFDAWTPDNLPHTYELNFQQYKLKKYNGSDTVKFATPTEQAIWYSHTSLWYKAFRQQKHTLILEHDCYPIDGSKVVLKPEYDFVSYDTGAMGCYMISSDLAQNMFFFLERGESIGVGPLGFVVDFCSKRKHYKIITPHTKGYVAACNQIYNKDFGTTALHYTDIDKQRFFDYIEVIDGKPIDPNRKISVSEK